VLGFNFSIRLDTFPKIFQSDPALFGSSIRPELGYSTRRDQSIAQFDEEETLRRRREKREARNIVDELSTSNIETMKLKNRIADSTLKIFVCLRVNKRLE